MSEIDRCLEDNEAYASGFDGGDLSSPPQRKLLIVTCMDARIAPAHALGIDIGDAHVLRNAGGIVTDDVIRSIAISQSALGTREVMIVQHTNCGMSSASDEEISDAIEGASGVRPTFRPGAFSDLEGEVRRSVATLRDSGVLAHRDAIRGFVYDTATGRVSEVSDTDSGGS